MRPHPPRARCHPHWPRDFPNRRRTRRAPTIQLPTHSTARAAHSTLSPLKPRASGAAPNARHHPRPHATYMRDCVPGRRVHAVVRRGLTVRLPIVSAVRCCVMVRLGCLHTPNPPTKEARFVRLLFVVLSKVYASVSKEQPASVRLNY